MSGAAIVGGGPAGAAAAIALARAGLRPRLLERDAVAQEKVCGEFLAEDAARGLAELGLDLVALGALPLRRAIFAAGRATAEIKLPFAAWSLPRARLDAALLEAAAAAGAWVEMGMAVAEAVPDGSGWALRLADGTALHAPALVLATGKHELRGLRRAAQGGALGLKLVLQGAAPDAAVTLLVCPGGYAGLQPRPDGGANLCAALDPHAAGVAAAARSAEAFVAHVAQGSELAARLLGAMRPAMARPLAVAGIPYGFLHRGDGPFRVGDQAAVIPSFCGDGVAMALRSGLRAAQALRAGVTAPAHHAAFAADIAGGMRIARGVSAAALRAPSVMIAGLRLFPGLAGLAARRTRLG
ncbi:NAD(P)/FAD-dependent oxidoreductase [Roseomonas sp. AR75]|uniref:NAD(P)/FAD-dependent oxidoreductase n=1 Tax=Roseomonas sp. AR75 TaxID=2562311 RepID=UPI0010BFF056|nr:FAD-dependent monooxygenase [Roseomonas sp. AR75]